MTIENSKYELRFEAKQEGDRIVRFTGSTAAPDRHGTILVPSGMRAEAYRANPVISFQHQEQSPDPDTAVIGRSLGETVLPDRVEVVVEFEPGNEVADKVLAKVVNGFLRGMSVTFSSIREHMNGDLRIVDEWELYAFSVVVIPSNPGALAQRSALSEEERQAMDKMILEKLGLSDGATFEDAVAACLQYMASTDDDKDTRGKVLAAVMALKPGEPDGDEARAADDKPADGKDDKGKDEPEIRAAITAIADEVKKIADRLGQVEQRGAALEQRTLLRNRIFGAEKRSAPNFGEHPEATPANELDAKIKAVQDRVAKEQAARTAKRG